MNKSLSNIDINRALNKQCKIIVYPEIINYRTLNELLYPYDACVILYEFKKNFGHWTTVFRYPNGKVEHFDSYGIEPDEELKFATIDFRTKNNEYFPYLTKLLYNSGDDIEYNNYPLQEHGKNINTCGRHVIVRLLNRHMNIDKYANHIYQLSDKYHVNPDELVTYLTKSI